MSTVAIYQRLVVAGGGFFLLLDLGLGAAACGMEIEINTGYSCDLTAARRRREHFFLLLDLGPGAAACEMGIEINTGYSLDFCGLFLVAQVPSGPSSRWPKVSWPKFARPH